MPRLEPRFRPLGASCNELELIAKSPSKHTYTMNNGWQLGGLSRNASVRKV